MGIFDNAVPGGNISKPLIIALGALLVGKMFSSNASQSTPGDPQTADSSNSDGGLLGGLLEKLNNAGHGDKAESWVQPGDNKSIEPDELGTALGNKTISEIAAQSGLSEQELLAQLSKVLPGIVDQLTPNGQVPNGQQIAALFNAKA